MSTDSTPPDDGRFTILGSETRYQGAIFSVRVDDVSMPGGGSARREVVDHLRAVAIAAIDEDHNIVMIEQYRHPMRRRLWELPAGLMDIDGEGPLVAARRELVEEVGLAADEWSVLVDITASPGFCTEAIRVYLATGLRDVPVPTAQDEEADLQVVRVPLEDAVDAVLDGRIVNATAVSGILAVARVLDTSVRDRLRPAADRWNDGPATVNTAPEIGRAPSLAHATR